LLSNPSPPLSGLRIIDFTSMIAGPYCTRLLADCGAEVIKIETEAGDYIRHADPIVDGQSTYFAQLNCGKKSIVLNLKKQKDLEAAIKLIRSADVVVENSRPGVMKRLGLDYATMSKDHPDLVYCSISGFGQTGPRANDPAYAPIVHAASGMDLAQLAYQDELTKPEKCGLYTADILAAINAFSAIQTALVGKFRFGNGQFIDVALMDCMINMMAYECQAAQFPTDKPRLLYSPTKTSDGFIIVSPISQNNFEYMADAMGHPEWKSDDRFIENKERRKNWATLTDLVEEWTATRPAKECEEILSRAGVPCSQYKTVAEAVSDPQTQERGLMVTVNDLDTQFKVPNPPYKFSDNTVGVVPHFPKHGEHTDEILAQLRGKG
jgi:CoA:oxalate CoA-transferase